MRKIQSHRLLLLLILIPPLLATCLCVAFLVPRSIDFFTSSSYPDYLWSLRITRVLSNKGYPVHDVSVSGSEPPGFRSIDVQVGNLVEGEQQRTYDLVKAVHSVVMETFVYSSSQPEPVDVVMVMVIDYSSGSYPVEIDFETLQKFQTGEISEQTYFEHWSYPENTPEITPP